MSSFCVRSKRIFTCGMEEEEDEDEEKKIALKLLKIYYIVA